MDDNLCSMTLTREYYLEEKKITHDFFIGILKINEEIFFYVPAKRIINILKSQEIKKGKKNKSNRGD